MKGIPESWKSFTDNQKKDSLPPECDNSEYNIAIFPSSKDEFASISSEWDNPLYKTQLDGLQQLSSHFNKLTSKCIHYLCQYDIKLFICWSNCRDTKEIKLNALVCWQHSKE
jgi:hypothetical protein